MQYFYLFLSLAGHLNMLVALWRIGAISRNKTEYLFAFCIFRIRMPIHMGLLKMPLSMHLKNMEQKKTMSAFASISNGTTTARQDLRSSDSIYLWNENEKYADRIGSLGTFLVNFNHPYFAMFRQRKRARQNMLRLIKANVRSTRVVHS